MTILYFSATGNSLSTAKYIGDSEDMHKACGPTGTPQLKSIPRLERAGEYETEDDVIGIVSPVYFLALPLLVRRYLSKAKLKGGYVFSVLTYGSFSGNATDKLVKVLQSNGNAIHYAATLKMVDNYLPCFKVENQLAGLPRKNVDSKLAEIKNDIARRRHNLPHTNVLLNVISTILSTKMETQRGMAAIKNTDKAFYVNESCNGCGICELVCPVSNIGVESRPIFRHHCESCFACIHNCTAHAIQLKCQRSEARFRNENVTLNELIAANGR